MDIQKECAACGTIYKVKPYRINTTKFCSIECKNNKQYTYLILSCNYCHKKFQVSSCYANKKFCSIDCQTESKTLERDANILRAKQKSIQRALRGNNSSRNTRKIAFYYKEKKCENCGYDEYIFCLDVHHTDGNPNNNSIDNLMILCAICHRKLHNKIITLDQILKVKG